MAVGESKRRMTSVGSRRAPWRSALPRGANATWTRRVVSVAWVVLLSFLSGALWAQPSASPTAPAPGPPGARAPAASAKGKRPSPPPVAVPPAASASSSAAPPPSGAVPTTAAPASAVDGATYAVRLRDLEARVDDLKEQIRRSHTRLSLLSDTILAGGVGGARAQIRFKTEMSGAFRLSRALFVLDGAVQFNKKDAAGSLSGKKEIPVFSGAIQPGDHTLQVLVQFRGHGYGVFSYLSGYQFEVKSSHSFTVTEGKTVEIDAIAWEQGGVTTPIDQRPAVRYAQRVRDIRLGVRARGKRKGGTISTKP